MADPIVGIDLGTSNSVVAHADAGGNVKVLADDQNYKIHPSVVSFHPNGGVVVGSPAKQRKVIDPQNTIFSVKRLIGRSFSSPEVKTAMQRMPFAIKKGDNDLPLIITRGGEFAVPEISAIVLDHVRNIANLQLDTEVTRAVVTVPASFNDAQRSATATAGAIAGLTVVRVLNEPTAAALAYGSRRSLKQTIAVYDFGGGTFDITILRLNDQVYEVLGTAGDTFLGGDDLDECLVDKMVLKFLAENRIDLRDNEVSMMRLRAVAEQTKIELSRRSRAVVRVDEIAYGAKGKPLNLQIEITRDEFVTQVADIIDKTFPVCKEALSYAQLGIDKIDDVILVGGTTKIPYVRDQVSKFFSKAPRTDVNPEDAVAVGAALQASSLERLLSRSGRISQVVDVPEDPDATDTMTTIEQEPSVSIQEQPPTRVRKITSSYPSTAEPTLPTMPAIGRADTSYSVNRAGQKEVFADKPPAAAIGRLRPTGPAAPLAKAVIPTSPITARGMATPSAQAHELSLDDSTGANPFASVDNVATRPGDPDPTLLRASQQRTTAPAHVAPPPAPPPVRRAPSAPPPPVPPRAKAPSTQPGMGAISLDLEDEAQPSASSTAKGFSAPQQFPHFSLSDPDTPTMLSMERPGMPSPSAPPAMPMAPMRAPVVMDVTPRSLGIGTVAGFCEELIRRNSRLPTQIVKMFTTSRDKQSAVRIVVCQGESRKIDNNVVIGDLHLEGLPPRPRGETSIEVTFSLDASGILQVRAKDSQTGAEQRATLDLVGGVRDENVAASRDRIQQLRRE